MVIQGHKSLIVLLTVVEEHVLVPASASQQISLPALSIGLISWLGFRGRDNPLRYRAREGKADDLAIMRLHEEFLGQRGIVQLMDPDITNLVTAGQMITIWADSNAPDRVDHVKQVNAALLCGHNWLPIFAPVKRTSLEVIVDRADLRVSLVELRLS